MDAQRRTERIRELAAEWGFARAAAAEAGPVGEPFASAYRRWVSATPAPELAYLRTSLEVRLDLRELLPTARSILCLAVSYAPRTEGAPPDRSADRGDGTGPGAKVARYARSRDYHKTLKARLHGLMDAVRREAPGFEGLGFVDTGPLPERYWAQRAGLGWIGRHGLLIVPGLGSYVLLAEIVSNLDLAPGRPIPPDCGACRACLGACPTRARPEPQTSDESPPIAGLAHTQLDPQRCVSFLNKDADEVAPDLAEAFGSWVFGCDRCQEVCPHNRGLPPGDPEFAHGPEGRFELPPLETLASWTQADWDAATRGWAIRSAGWRRFRRNVLLAASRTASASAADGARPREGLGG